MNMPMNIGIDPKDILWIACRPWLWPIASAVVGVIVVRTVLERWR